MQTFRVKLGCDNCGHDAIYILPRKSVIVDWKKAEEDYQDTTYSYYHPFKKPEERTYLTCQQCGLAMLKVFWWQEPAVVPLGQREEIDGSGTSRESS